MMNETAFAQSLKKSGKKTHVVGELVGRVKRFEAFLSQRSKVLDSAEAQDIRDYVDTLAERDVKEAMRAVALYYQFAGSPELARTAGEIRQQRIVKKAFKLRDFMGVNLGAVFKLGAMGIVTVEQMLAVGKTPQDRQKLAEETGISPEIILELVKLSDLTRLAGVKSVRARLYYDAGLDTPHKFATWEPDALRAMLVEFVACSGFKGIAPLPKELRSTVAAAKALPNVVEYE